MLATDSVALGDIRVSDGGYLEAIARTARTGVQTYRGAEVGKPELSTVSVYRDEAEVFSKRSLDSFSKIPLTIDHPSEPVTSANWKHHAVGTTGDDVLRDGEALKIGLKITDAAAVAAVQNGRRELSVGYTTNLVWEDGKAPDGTPYQARQTAIVANHIAIVAAGRAGPQCRIGDSWADFTKSPNPQEKPTMSDTRTVMVDGFSVLVTDQSAQAIEKLLTDRDTARKALSDAETAHQTALATKDADLAKKDAEIDGLKAKVLDAAALDAAVAARGDLVAKAKAIAPNVVTDGKTDAEIRHAVVAAKIGDAAIKDKAPAYVDARFDILAEDAKPADAFRNVVKDGITTVNVDDALAARDKALAARAERYANGHKTVAA